MHYNSANMQFTHLNQTWSQNIVVSTAGSYSQDVPGIESRQRQEIFFSPKPLRLSLGHTQTTIQWLPGFFLGGKAAGA